MDTSRGLVAAGVLLSAVVHLDVWQQGFRNIHTIGPLFLLSAVGGFGIGVMLLARRHWLPAVAAVGVATGAPVLLAELDEYAAVFFGLAAAALLSQPMRERVA